MTTTPSIWMTRKRSRMALTAAWSSAFLLPRPIQRAAASAAASVTRDISIAMLRSSPPPEWRLSRLVSSDLSVIGAFLLHVEVGRGQDIRLLSRPDPVATAATAARRYPPASAPPAHDAPCRALERYPPH